ncbi:MAG: D-alanine--D-alanine ligase family protein [Actinomycetota bacterium]
MARVLLLFGGRSSEHEVSCASAVSVHDALVEAGHRVIPVGIDRDGSWYLSDPTFRPFRAEGRSVELNVPSGSLRVADHGVEFDVVFPVLHGPFGEDGTIQGLLDTCGLPYVGCGVLGSSLAMDKDLAKRVVQASGIATTPWLRLFRHRWDEDAHGIIDQVVTSLHYPVFVKPAAQGSSIGVSRAESDQDLKDALTNAFRYDSKVIVERAVAGREIEVGVIDGPASSVPGEVITESAFYTYDAKYADDSSRFEAPARLPRSAASEVRSLAERVFTELGLSGLARIDFFYDQARGRFLFNEANTLPGFTSISGFPKMWVASGMTYPEICSHLVDAAFTRHEERGRLSIR